MGVIIMMIKLIDDISNINYFDNKSNLFFPEATYRFSRVKEALSSLHQKRIIIEIYFNENSCKQFNCYFNCNLFINEEIDLINAFHNYYFKNYYHKLNEEEKIEIMNGLNCKCLYSAELDIDNKRTIMGEGICNANKLKNEIDELINFYCNLLNLNSLKGYFTRLSF